MHLHLTANTRLSQQLKQDLHSPENLISHTPTIMTWQQWWSFWFEEALLAGELDITNQPKRTISAFEAQQKWQEMLEELDTSYQLLNSQTTAKELYRAWELWHQYNQPTFEHGTQEWQVFQKLADSYTQWLKKHQLQDQSQQIQTYLNLALQGVGAQPTSVTWHGFNDYTPQMLAWQNYGEENGTSHQIQADTTSSKAKTFSFEAKNQQEEAQQATAYAIKKLQDLLTEGRQLNTIKIGLIAPNIQDYKNQLAYQLDDQLFQAFANHPLSPSHSAQRLYNFSLGTPLPTRPYANYLTATLKMLHSQPSLDFQSFSSWLLHPYLPSNKSQRANYDKQLRQKKWPTIYWNKLTKHSEPPLPLAKFLDKLTEIKTKISNEKIGLAGFQQHILQLLNTLHQATPITLNSDEHQAYTRLEETITEFSKMQSFASRTPNEWWQLLNLWLHNQTHQSKSIWPQPIQISGLLEAAGQKFDAIWILGLDDQNFPSPAKPNSFLPLPLQRQLRMPNCDSEKEHEYAEKLLEQLQNSSQELIFSYSKMQDDAQLMPSPLIASYPAQAPLPVQSLITSAHQSDQITFVLDDQAPEIPKNTTLKGGTGLLDTHLKCPLMAFIDYRLNARNSLEDVSEGLDSADQGNLVHNVLEAFWQATKTQNALSLLTAEELDEKLEELIDLELTKPDYKKHNANYLEQEKTRVKQLITDWLELEKERPESFQVMAHEQQAELKIADYKLNVKIDRIDKTPSGKIIIDYKTGKASINTLTDGKSLQLASYLYHLTETPSALAYGILHAKDGIRWSSLSETGGLLSSNPRSRQEISWEKEKEKDASKPDWPEALAEFKSQVAQLVTEIGSGAAPMIYAKETDLAYANGKLALRLPEAREQLANFSAEEE